MQHGQFKYFSTFSGIGGFELGIERSLGAQCADAQRGPPEPQIQQRRQRTALEEGRGILHPDLRRQRPIRCVGYSEIDRYASQIYRRHFPGHINFGDITRIDAGSLPDFDLLVGGFPCQAFSIAGRRGGFDDARGTLFFDIARILRAKRPARFVLENVRGLLSHDDGRTFKVIIAALVDLGYGVEWQVLNSKNHGVPQNRERVFFVGYLGGRCARQIFPLGSYDQISDGALVTDGGQAQAPISHALRGSNIKADQTFVLHELTPSGTADAQRIYDADGIGRTLKGESGGQGGKMGLYRIGARVRRLTPTECERLQGFPDGWTRFGPDGEISDTQRYKALGNAVTVNVVAAIMMELLHGTR